MVNTEQAVDVSCFIKPANSLELQGDDIGYPHQRITGIYFADQCFGEREIDASERTLTLPLCMAKSLAACIEVSQSAQYYNCHRFSKAIAGLLDPAWDEAAHGPEPEEHFGPPASALPECSEKTCIGLGAIGVIGVTAPQANKRCEYSRVPHSVVGLGDNISESLHFTTYDGMISLVNNENLLEYYRNAIVGATRIGLYQVTRGAQV